MGARLRQQGDQRVLAQEGGLPGHVRPRQQPDRRGVAVRQRAVVGHKGLTLAAQGAFHHRMPSAHDLKRAAVVHRRGAPVFRGRQVGEGCREVDFRQGAGGQRNRGGPVQDLRL